MIDRYKLTICLALFLLSMTSAPDSGVAANLSLGKSVMLAGSVTLAQEPVAVVDGDKAWALFYGEGAVHNHLLIANLDQPGRTEDVYRLAAGPNRLGGLGIAARDGNRYIAWKAKFGTEKYLYFSRSEPGKGFSKLMTLNRRKSALLPVSLGAGSDGLIVAAWIDERRGQLRDAYIAISRDGGKTFSKDVRASENYDQSAAPVLRVQGKSIHLFFVGAKSSSAWLVHRWSEDAGRTWHESHVVKASRGGAPSQITPLQTSWKAPGAGSPRLLIFWAVGKRGLKAAYSDDGGATWRQAEFPEDGKDEAVITIDAVGVDGRINLVDTIVFVQDKSRKPDSFVQMSDDGGRHWRKRQRISSEPYHLTMNLKPRISASSTGRLIICWQDYRNIRSNLYLRASTDYGKTWGQDTLLEEAGRFSSMSPRIVNRSPGIFDIIFKRLSNDLHENGELWKKRVELK